MGVMLFLEYRMISGRVLGDLSKVDLEDVAGPGAKVQAFEVPEIESVFVHKLDVHVFYSICHNCPQFMAAFIYVFLSP